MAKPRYSLTRALAAAETQGSPEYESHFELKRQNASWKDKLGIGSLANKPYKREICVPWDKLTLSTRDLTTQTQASGAFTVGLDVPVVQKSLRPTSLMMRLPITVIDGLEGNLVLPRISTGVSPVGGSEIQSLTTGDPAFGAANAGPQRLLASVTFSKELLALAGGNEAIDRVLTTELLRALSFQVDQQLLTGSGVNGQALGILTQSATSTNTYVAANGFSQIIGVQKQLEDGLVDSNNACWLLSTATAKLWRTLLKNTSTAHFILDGDGKVNDIAAYVTSYIPSTSDQTVVADWTQLVVGVFGQGIDLVYDVYTKAASGEIIISCNLWWQVFIRRPSVFVVSTNAGSIFTS